MEIRTDLLTEQQEGVSSEIKGIKSLEEHFDGGTVSTVEILNEDAARKLSKPIGKYCTVEFDRLDRVSDIEGIITAVVNCLKKLAPEPHSCALVVGLGNTDITPDALGPFVANGVLATRHLSSELKKTLGLESLKSVCSVVPGVLGKTGIEAFDLISAAVEHIKPSIIIAVDALAARSATRLCRTVQLSDSGICPGSGVNNARKELSEATFSIPVIAVGVPTVIDANSFLPEDIREDSQENMMVTPKDIDLLISKSATILSRALNIFLQPELDVATLDSLT